MTAITKTATGIELRTAAREDEGFLFLVYASTRQEELAFTDWDDTRKTEFLKMQFSAQDRYYKENYPGALFNIILVNGRPAGRLYVHYRPDEIRIMDIALVPEYRNRGIGTSILRGILGEGKGKVLPVTIHVEAFNPALRLYERLGFRKEEDKGVYFLLKWSGEGING